MLKVTLKPLETEKAIFAKGWTRQQLSNETGISNITISRLLNGKSCSIQTALKITFLERTHFLVRWIFCCKHW